MWEAAGSRAFPWEFVDLANEGWLGAAGSFVLMGPNSLEPLVGSVAFERRRFMPVRIPFERLLLALILGRLLLEPLATFELSASPDSPPLWLYDEFDKEELLDRAAS